MEKRKPSYSLDEIKAAFSSANRIRITATGYRNAIQLGLRRSDIAAVVQALEPADFYKSMTSHADYKIWQDVYHGKFKRLELYIKFMTDSEGLFIISFKEK